MRILIEAHHPAHIHFWKYPIRELQERGHEVLMIGRDRDVMKRLLAAYDWINAELPPRPSTKNRFPLREMLIRQRAVASAIRRFRPDVVASLMGSYCQSARLFGRRNIIFTDTETQTLNHRIAHPFADEIHTPACFQKNLGPKQRRYSGIHELCFLDGRRFQPDRTVLKKYEGLEPHNYLLVRLSAWNTLHDRSRQGTGAGIYPFVERTTKRWRVIISAEENKVPPGLEEHALAFAPEEFHHLLAYSRFVLTEGASTASEAACLGVPSVFINSTELLGNFVLLGDFGLVQSFREGQEGIDAAESRLKGLENGKIDGFLAERDRFIESHEDVCAYVVRTLEQTTP